ncbi:MAG: MBL fold metallo-hydrolase [Candidatus Woesearchaeota archaeon]|nr:MBL fold metallo-hydrolase [Candidatus Woesearchaeota archaeon]
MIRYISKRPFVFVIVLILMALCLLYIGGCSNKPGSNEESPAKKSGVVEMKLKNIEGVNIAWLGHASFMIKDSKTIYIDPFQLPNNLEKADLLLITHEHYDHCSISDINKIVKPETIIVTVPDCQSKLSGLKVANVTLVRPGNKLNVRGTMIEAVPSYNTNKKFHPKDNEWVGFIITVNGKRIYHAGDTDAIPEMKSLSNIDIALVPVSGTYVMTAEEAAKAVNEFKPKTAVPMHYGSIIGNASDAQKFKSLAKVPVVIFE